MKIILSPSKEMAFENNIDKKIKLNEISQEILNEIKKMTKADLQKKLKVSDKLIDEVYGYYQDFDKNLAYYALDMYRGMAFKEMDFGVEDNFARDHIVILSAFYGPLRTDDLVKPYRLDFNTRIKVEGMSLKKLWADYYNNYFEKGERILNLASDEFSSLLKRDDFDFIDFDFYELRYGKIKRHSTISKKLRGKMANFIVKNKIINIEDLKDFNDDGFLYDKENSNDKLYVFRRDL
uniref:YaaA family protein n=1 Tax=Ezakiella massiliensis TaxID=1852374 RepID=UPI00094F206E|nr:peroxide stress protein YaaA [Ezakiella massiliensis]